MPRELVGALRAEAERKGLDLTALVVKLAHGYLTDYGLPEAATALLDEDRAALRMDRDAYVLHLLFQRSMAIREQGPGFDAPGRGRRRSRVPTSFRKLNDGWNAEPNAPAEAVSVAGDTVVLEFKLNPYAYAGFAKGERGRLTFTGCTKYRLGSTNDEGWFRGQCRFSKIAPAWGEFYEVTGDLLDERISDWTPVPSQATGPRRRFLFYLRDDTFEVDAQDCRFERVERGAG